MLLDFYSEGRAERQLRTGIELALQRILVSPSFLFRTEFAPALRRRAGAYRISDLELASRLSFFLWSSIPDDELLDLATQGKLREPAVLERQTRRMLADPRSEAFTTNFAGQWLSLRRLPDIVPDPFLFPDYGDTLALAFQREAELFFGSIVREDRPALELLTANYTFVNERLAQHYGIPNVKGINFRRVDAGRRQPASRAAGEGRDPDGHRAAEPDLAGRSRQMGAAERCSARRRPSRRRTCRRSQENGEKVTKVQHAAASGSSSTAPAPVCASCHKLMDPIGFALESFDAVGQYRTYDENFEPIDNTGVYADGTRIDGLAGLRQVLVESLRSVPRQRDQDAAHLCARPRRGVLRRAGGPRRSCATRRHRITASRQSFSASSRALHFR